MDLFFFPEPPDQAALAAALRALTRTSGEADLDADVTEAAVLLGQMLAEEETQERLQAGLEPPGEAADADVGHFEATACVFAGSVPPEDALDWPEAPAGHLPLEALLGGDFTALVSRPPF